MALGVEMIIRDSKWSEIREQFTEEEKTELRKSVTGEAICPRGFIVDVENIEPVLRQKLTTAMRW